MILVNNEPIDALSMVVHRSVVEARGRHMCERIKDLIPRHQGVQRFWPSIGHRIGQKIGQKVGAQSSGCKKSLANLLH